MTHKQTARLRIPRLLEIYRNLNTFPSQIGNLYTCICKKLWACYSARAPMSGGPPLHGTLDLGLEQQSQSGDFRLWVQFTRKSINHRVIQFHFNPYHLSAILPRIAKMKKWLSLPRQQKWSYVSVLGYANSKECKRASFVSLYVHCLSPFTL